VTKISDLKIVYLLDKVVNLKNCPQNPLANQISVQLSQLCLYRKIFLSPLLGIKTEALYSGFSLARQLRISSRIAGSLVWHEDDQIILPETTVTKSLHLSQSLSQQTSRICYSN
jgi:hypothetical protein